MATRVSGKKAWFRFLASFLPAAALSFFLCVFLDGPRLGPVYDYLQRRRPALPVSRELLVIDSAIPGGELGSDILEPGTASSLLYTMAEFGAETLIIQVPILGLSAGGSPDEDEILYYFDEEFSILSGNIRNLFDAIRTGSIAPGEAARYVGELVELSEKGKERLVAALVRRDEEGIISMEKAAAFFGRARRPGDLRVQLIRSGESGRPGILADSGEYSKARPDKDGVLRRISPALSVPDLSRGNAGEKTLEHIIYGALKSRFASCAVEPAGAPPWQPYPLLAARNGPDGRDRIIPLDRNGAVLFEAPRAARDFRRIGIAEFLAYDELDRNLKRLLLEGDALGIFRNIEGEARPGILYDYALSVREEPDSAFPGGVEEKKRAWIEARDRYFACLDDFLYGPAEMNLVGAFEEIIGSEFSPSGSASGFPGEDGAVKMAEMRDSVIKTFVALRAAHSEILELREKLDSALSSSFCILGSDPDLEASALLANSILSGRAVKAGDGRYLLVGSLLSALLLCFFIKALNPLPALGLGALFTFLAGAGFSLAFVLSGFWLDPQAPLAACAAATLVSCMWAVISRARFGRRFRLAYGARVSAPLLKSIIRNGGPLPSRIVNARTAAVAVNYPDAAASLRSSVLLRTGELLAFQKKAAGLFKKSGGIITGTEGDALIVCFGSPLENASLPAGESALSDTALAEKAVSAVSEIARLPECASWYFGIDMGDCDFTWSELSGYFARGVPVRSAAKLAAAAGRYKARIVISAPIKEALREMPVRKLGAFDGKNGREDGSFYRLDIASARG